VGWGWVGVVVGLRKGAYRGGGPGGKGGGGWARDGTGMGMGQGRTWSQVTVNFNNAAAALLGRAMGIHPC
jgi:hypothetical protein